MKEQPFRICTILGVPVCVTNMDAAADYVENKVEELRGKYICVGNVHTTVMAYENKSYMEVQRGAAAVFPDGRPLSVLSRKRGFPEAERVAGPDFMKQMFQRGNAGDGLRHFFYGAAENTLQHLSENLKAQYPNLQIAGMYAPPFRELTDEEEKQIVEMINVTNPDIIWIGLGAPKQENWMAAHQDILKGVMLGVGAGFDFHAGTVKRAPVWMQKLSLEWLYRLTQDPKRLWKRYLCTNLKFIFKTAREKNKHIKATLLVAACCIGLLAGLGLCGCQTAKNNSSVTDNVVDIIDESSQSTEDSRAMKSGDTALPVEANMQSETETQTKKDVQDNTEAKARIAQMLEQMSLEEKIGQLMLVDIRNWKMTGADESALVQMNDEVASVLQKYHLGSVILASNNTQKTDETVRLVFDMQQAVISSKDVPLLIGIDQEGGQITRLKQGTCMPGNMAIGASGNTKLAYENGTVIGSELAALGINCDFAPDADVNNNPENPVIGLRSFGADSQKVAEMVVQMSEGLKSEGVIACVKHFPGHGNTSTDTHTGLALVEKTKEEWNTCEKLPFESAVSQGIDMVMTAHIQYPNLDNTQIASKKDGEQIYLPATLSKKIVTGILRDEMGFDGVVVTDALNMQAIADYFGETEAVVMALQAGVDLMCCPTTLRSISDTENLSEIYTAIENAIADGTLSMERIDEAAGRVLLLKEKYGILNLEQYQEPIEDKTAYALKIVGGEEHRLTERKLADASVQLIKNEGFGIFTPTDEQTVLVCMPYESELASVRYAIDRMQKEGTAGKFQTIYVSYQEMMDLSADLQKKIEKADYLIVGSERLASANNEKNQWLNLMPEKILKTGTDCGKKEHTAVLCTGLPYGTEKYSAFPYVLCYTTVGMQMEDAVNGTITGKYGPNIPAAIEKIFTVQEEND